MTNAAVPLPFPPLAALAPPQGQPEFRDSEIIDIFKHDLPPVPPSFENIIQSYRAEGKGDLNSLMFVLDEKQREEEKLERILELRITALRQHAYKYNLFPPTHARTGKPDPAHLSTPTHTRSRTSSQSSSSPSSHHSSSNMISPHHHHHLSPRISSTDETAKSHKITLPSLGRLLNSSPEPMILTADRGSSIVNGVGNQEFKLRPILSPRILASKLEEEEDDNNDFPPSPPSSRRHSPSFTSTTVSRFHDRWMVDGGGGRKETCCSSSSVKGSFSSSISSIDDKLSIPSVHGATTKKSKRQCSSPSSSPLPRRDKLDPKSSSSSSCLQNEIDELEDDDRGDNGHEERKHVASPDALSWSPRSNSSSAPHRLQHSRCQPATAGAAQAGSRKRKSTVATTADSSSAPSATQAEHPDREGIETDRDRDVKRARRDPPSTHPTSLAKPQRPRTASRGEDDSGRGDERGRGEEDGGHKRKISGLEMLLDAARDAEEKEEMKKGSCQGLYF